MSAAPDAAVRAFYADRTYSPVWIKADLGGLNPLGLRALSAIKGSEAHGLSAFVQTARNLERLTAAPLSAEVAGRLEGGLSSVFTRFVERLHRPEPENGLIWTDRDMAPDHRPAAVLLSILASAPRPAAALAGMLQMHPAYEALALLIKRARTGDLDTGPLGGSAAFLKKAATNLDRLRALPVHATARHLMVNIASATLQTYESGVVGKTMRVIVGRAATPTPLLSGTIRHAVLNPYWNIPQDLLRGQVAPAVLKGGADAFNLRRLEALSGWSNDAAILKPEEVDWRAVASGRRRLRVRQLPGPKNMMGAVKFMLPNDLGIYLHDTPDRAAFDRPSRALSAGCVRVEDPDWLFRWLFGADLTTFSNDQPEMKIPLNAPVPIYLTYQTLTPTGDGTVQTWPDVYSRDA